jgi:hypothetical protein
MTCEKGKAQVDDKYQTEEMSEPEDLAALEALLGRALTDEKFRDALLEAPAETAESVGIELTPYQVARIESLNPGAMKVVSAAFKESLALGFTNGPFW